MCDKNGLLIDNVKALADRSGLRRSGLRDMLTEIMHICKETNEDFHDLLDGAREVFHMETD